MISKKQFQKLLEAYHREVPFVGTITFEKANQILEEGKICRGWILGENGLEFFHIVKSPSNYPDLSILMGPDEETLLVSTVMMGMQNNIDLEKIFHK